MPTGHLERFEHFAIRQGKIIYDKGRSHRQKKNDRNKIQVSMWVAH